ncbi:bifunctional acetaldehyde-CoA/alcohol dehydrogenase [Limnothrix sp. FACHB-881]|uniref:bifunctional acetaldehyde-CoA/alcohol dehydrogenase n=1 Tax=unclassified Limnothrix TaxID=2632864 RepID=UPI00081F27F2|nr:MULTISPECIES: bifunctional acetaldehyde-CoA/alcohol dehydrogenase [unclassified Limnothrix]MBD2634708.1 bifunctional acetaldehyde-CoA/alcohol dehydrogenase [Limnothrix sp. FACHB-881]OCQ96193.1 bifunctional acetaldehyde-CoA/alcohol dehydrogenase [Limnothrix sp. P13C2]PIB15412.1 acetaldehyde dehydrogenase [Limnothrix sp. PR1529]
MTVTNDRELEALIARVKAAQRTYATFSQEQVDLIFKKAALAANAARIPLAKLAVTETRMGTIEDKVIKNHFASEFIYNKYKAEKTCGVIEEDKAFGIQRIAEPVGILAGIVPTTNPTSTAIFKALIALKTRNAIIFSPHPRAKDCTIEAARVILQAAVEAGAPPDIIGWIDQPTVPLSQQLMQHPDVNLILATGGPGMVRAAYSSGHPSLGVGAGNTPALIDETAHLKMAVSSIILSKTFDNGMICASEQSVVVVDAVYEQVKQEFRDRGAYFLDPEEKVRMGAQILIDGRLNPNIVGQSVEQIAAMAEIQLPPGTRLIVGEASVVGPEEPFSYEKLSPVLAMYRAADFAQAVELSESLVMFAGRGHTAVLYTSPDNRDRIKQFEDQVQTARVLINTPSSQGAIGDIYNFRLDPSLTLGCGTWGGNSISENVEPRHLLNIKTVAERRENMLWFRIPPKIYFKYGSLPVALRELAGRDRAFIITDKPLYNLGITAGLESVLDDIGLKYDTFYDVEPDPCLGTVNRILEQMRSFNPDTIIAIGGGSPMDAAKIAWLLYEHPEIEFEGLSMRFMDIRKRVYELPPLGQKAILVAIPTTSGTGSEVTPFAVVTDERTGIKYPLADYALTPTMAICDPQLVLDMPKSLTAFGGVDALTHALESYVSVLASEFTNGEALEAIRLIFKYLPSAYEHGAADPKAREKMHYAATMAGMAFANGFLGICHSIAHQIGGAFHIPHGLANALLISHVIRYNATDAPFKQAAFPQYKYPNAKWRYARIADYLNLGGTTEDEKIDRLIGAIEALKQQVGIPRSIREATSISEAEFLAKLDDVADRAFDDQCTVSNPRYPMISELKTLLLRAYHGDSPLLSAPEAPEPVTTP